MSKSVWDSDFGAIFKQRYDILADRDIKKGIAPLIGAGIGGLAAGPLGAVAGAGAGEALDTQKMEKEEENFPGDKGLVRGGRRPIQDKKYKTNDVLEGPFPPPPPDLEENIAPYKSLRKAIRSIDRVLKAMSTTKQPVNKSVALNKSIKSVTKMLHKLDSCGGSTAGLNIKNVKAKKEGGGVFPAKAPPKPQTKKAK
jgi:hypothetical protein